jgi:HAE1 family hydrophobic/amphiphilic exporter-1
MRAFIRFITRYPHVTIIVIVATGLAGGYAALHMPVDLFPNLAVPVVNIITHYPGASPQDIELLITRPIEDQMRTIPGVKRVASTSGQGISQVTVEFAWSLTVFDANQLVQSRLAQVQGTLPAGATPWLANIGTTLQEVCGYIFYGSDDLIALRNTVRYEIANRLMGTEGVSYVQVIGGDQRAYFVRFQPKTLVRLSLPVEDVISSLAKANASVAAGYLERSGKEYLVRGDARLETLDDLRSLPIVRNGEPTLLLGKAAEIYEGKSPRHYEVRGNGVPAVAMIVSKQPGASTDRVVAGVDQAMSGLHSLLPPGTNIKKFYDQSEIIRESQDEIVRDLIIGALLVVLVLYFFLGALRPTLIVAMTIPLTLLATLMIMRLLGLGFNMVTLTALALCVGMIVDDAIVVAENIYRHRKISANALEASVSGAAEIAGPDASGTFTTVAAFLPLVIVTGIAALFLRPFGLTVSIALLVSLVLSLTLVPLMFSRSKGPLVKDEDFLGARLLGFLNRILQRTLRFSFRHKALVIGVAVLSLSVAGLVTMLDKVSLLPPIDEGAILIEYVMPPGTSLPESNRIGELLDCIALADPDVTCVYRRTGSSTSGYQVEGVNRGELYIKLKPKTQRARSLAATMDSLKKSYSSFEGVVFLYHQPTQEKMDESLSGLPALFGVTIYGTDLSKLIFLARQVEDVLYTEPAVTNVVNETKEMASQLDVRLDYARLALHRIEPSEVLSTLQAACLGVEATQIIRQKEDVAIWVKLGADVEFDPDRVRRLPIVLPNGGNIPLENIADVRVRQTPAAITRLNGERELTLVAEVDGSIPTLVSHLQKKFQAIQLPQGYSIGFSGQYKILMQAAYEMLFALAAALLLIYLIMLMQFGSWLQPLIIMGAIPLSLVGALLALFVTGQGIDVSVGMGAFTLVGIAVNNAIVLVDFANRRAAPAADTGEALLEAASVRLRPILLTNLVTFAALLPAAIGTTVGSQIFKPFAITVIGGLLSHLVASLIMVPTLLFTFSRKATHKDKT